MSTTSYPMHSHHNFTKNQIFKLMKRMKRNNACMGAGTYGTPPLSTLPYPTLPCPIILAPCPYDSNHPIILAPCPYDPTTLRAQIRTVRLLFWGVFGFFYAFAHARFRSFLYPFSFFNGLSPLCFMGKFQFSGVFFHTDPVEYGACC